MSSVKQDRGPLLYFAAAGMIVSFLAGAFLAGPYMLAGTEYTRSPPPTTRNFTLVIQATDIQEGPDAVWHAWTYNGTVPGPTLHAWVGDKLVIKVINHLDLMVSLHTHLVNYNFTSDGSQANIIVGMGAGSMIMPGESYTYEFSAEYAGVFLYHDHSSDQHPISYHIGQGLYGVFVIDDPRHPPPKLAHEWTVGMAEIGARVEGSGYAPYIMNGIGFPGGEPALMDLYQSQGIAGVAAEFNKTLPAYVATVGDTVRFNVFNPGAPAGLIHTFHLHDAKLVSEFQFPMMPYNDANIALDPGVTDSALVTLSQPGIFLFHCHLVPHADAGMIGVLVVLPKSTGSTSASSTQSSSHTSSSVSMTMLTSSTTLGSTTSGSMVHIPANAAGNPSSPGYFPTNIHVVLGVNNTVTWMSDDTSPHTVTSSPAGAFDSGNLGAGQSWTHTFTSPGTYNYYCVYHTWMMGSVTVSANP